MAIYAIGDIHGHPDALNRLLSKLSFDPLNDMLWFVGDLVNRGPDSPGCVRRIMQLGNAAVTILGNHDLALLVQARRQTSSNPASDTLAAFRDASDGDELLDWLRYRPLIHTDEAIGWTMVHAGIPAEWSLAAAHRHAAELTTALRGQQHADVLSHLFGNQPSKWSEALNGIDRLRYITNALTRQRMVDDAWQLDMSHKSTVAEAPQRLRPWFRVAARKTRREKIIFGHWAALSGVHQPPFNVWCIDTGAAWNGSLTAMRLDTAKPALTAVMV